MGLLKEFKEFSMRGNVMDIAVGLIVGAAFGGIVTSFVSDILMPPIGLLIGGVDFRDLRLIMKASELDAAGKIVKDAVSINYGKFVQTVLDFLIIAFAVFVMIKVMNSLKKKEVSKPVEVPPVKEEVILLSQIRDLLEKKQ
jgi:large conductance mechanosensitive channel